MRLYFQVVTPPLLRRIFTITSKPRPFLVGGDPPRAKAIMSLSGDASAIGLTQDYVGSSAQSMYSPRATIQLQLSGWKLGQEAARWPRWNGILGNCLTRHFPANLQIHGNRIYIAPPRELHSLRSPPMTRLWRADHVRKAIWQRFPPSRHTSPVFSTLPSISSAYAGTGLRRRSSIKAKIFWNKIFDTATSASWNVT